MNQKKMYHYDMVKADYFITDYEKQEKNSLRSHMIRVPECINDCRGIHIFGKKIKSIAFTTDIAVICNINADAVMAVYPFTPQTSIIRSITSVATMPVLAGVGGGITNGVRTWNMANNAEQIGAYGVVVNAPIDNETISGLRTILEIPVIVTVVSDNADIKGLIQAGASMFNVAGGKDTAKIVQKIRSNFPDVKIIATGGPTNKSIIKTIKAGADAITYTPPSCSELCSEITAGYRQ